MEQGEDSRGGSELSRIRILGVRSQRVWQRADRKAKKNKEFSQGYIKARMARHVLPHRKCGRIPKDDSHKSASEGEGACSRTCAGRSHLPLRGKLGWMTPRSGQKKTGKRNASFGAPVPKQEPQFF